MGIHDGSAVGFYNPSATVHDKSLCTLDYVGCTDPTAANYMPWARVNSGCIANIVGCLHPAALNKNCGGPTSYLSFTECTGSGLARSTPTTSATFTRSRSRRTTR